MPRELEVADAPFDGRWWIPETPEESVAGRLSLEEGFWRLVLFDWLGEWDEEHTDKPPALLLHGMVGGTPITVSDLVSGGWKSIAGERPFQTRYAVNTVIAGIHTTTEARYRGAQVRLLNLNEWANRRPWRFSEDDIYSVTVEPHEGLSASVSGANVSLWRGRSQNGAGSLSEIRLTSDERVHFEFTQAIQLDEIEHDYIRPLRGLLELAATAPGETLEFLVTPEGDEEGWHTGAVLSAEARRPPPEPIYPFFFLFTLADLPFEEVIPKWWDLHKRLGVVADLLATTEGYVGQQFLNAASAIEGYHRHLTPRVRKTPEHRARLRVIRDAVPERDRSWVMEHLAFSHEPTFSERVDYVINRAGETFSSAIPELGAWKKWVKDGRNAVAHRDPGMVDVDAEWRVTVRVTDTIRWALTLALLKDLGFGDAFIEQAVRRNRAFPGSIALLREAKPEWFSPTPEAS
jgi:hypothetical protein